MINSHIHIFLEKDIPRGFLPFGLVKILSTKVGYFLLARILKNLNPFSNKDEFDRYCQFVKVGKNKTQEDILNECAENYPKDTKFVILPMDMAFMEAGTVPRNYEEQLAELLALSIINTNVIPFIHIDPRRNKYLSLFYNYIGKGFKGVKLYPPLGIYPFDMRFSDIYKYCEMNGIPILAHCTAGNPVHFKGSFKELKKLLENKNGHYINIDWSKSKRELCSYFTHPDNYRSICETYPNLKICLAHFGRENEWDKIIRRMMKIYPNLYADISYSLYNTEHWGYLKVLLSTDIVFRNKCLFGSDYYMNIIEGKEKQFSINLRAFLGEELWEQIAIKNPRKYLGNIKN